MDERGEDDVAITESETRHRVFASCQTMQSLDAEKIQAFLGAFKEGGSTSANL